MSQSVKNIEKEVANYALCVMCQKVKQLVIESYPKSDLMTSVPAFAQIVTYYTFLKCIKSLETHRSDYRLLL